MTHNALLIFYVQEEWIGFSIRHRYHGFSLLLGSLGPFENSFSFSEHCGLGSLHASFKSQTLRQPDMGWQDRLPTVWPLPICVSEQFSLLNFRY